MLTLESAYYYYNMSDDIPDEYHLATDRKSARIVDDRVTSTVPQGSQTLKHYPTPRKDVHY